MGEFNRARVAPQTEGLPLISGDHFIQADDPEHFAQAVISLLRDPIRRKGLGMAGRKLVEERYSWRHVALEFEGWCEKTKGLHGHRGS